MKTEIFFLWLAALAVTSCGRLFDGDRPVISPQEFSIDGMKLISPAIRYGDDEAAWGRDTYTISPASRLLMRFESLSHHASDVVVETDSTVTLQIRLVDSGRAADAVGYLRLCPLTRPWMMLATWTKARHYGEARAWAGDGAEGDYDRQGCATPDPLPDGVLSFDIKRWFLDYPRGRGRNYGHILIYDRNEGIEITGERSGTYSPRLFFRKYVTYSSSARGKYSGRP